MDKISFTPFNVGNDLQNHVQIAFDSLLNSVLFGYGLVWPVFEEFGWMW